MHFKTIPVEVTEEFKEIYLLDKSFVRGSQVYVIQSIKKQYVYFKHKNSTTVHKCSLLELKTYGYALFSGSPFILTLDSRLRMLYDAIQSVQKDIRGHNIHIKWTTVGHKITTNLECQGCFSLSHLTELINDTHNAIAKAVLSYN